MREREREREREAPRRRQQHEAAFLQLGLKRPRLWRGLDRGFLRLIDGDRVDSGGGRERKRGRERESMFI